jgi:hypothetical protein
MDKIFWSKDPSTRILFGFIGEFRADILHLRIPIDCINKSLSTKNPKEFRYLYRYNVYSEDYLLYSGFELDYISAVITVRKLLGELVE